MGNSVINVVVWKGCGEESNQSCGMEVKRI